MKHSLIKKLKQRKGIVIMPNSILDNWMHLRIPKALNRYHQKVKLIDDDVFIGSININNQYGGMRYGTFHFIDLNLFLKKSPEAERVASFFKRMLWTNRKFSHINNNDIPEERKDVSKNFEEFLEETHPLRSEISDKIIEMIKNAKDNITIIQSYYLNIPKIEEMLIQAMKRGVKVEIITAKKRDQLTYKYFLNEILFEKLLKEGAKVYEFLDKSFHMKAYCVDNKILNLGSFNNDITSFYCNNEANYLIRKNGKNNNVFNDFNKLKEELKENCHQVVMNKIKRLPFFNMWAFRFFTFGFLIVKAHLSSRKKDL